MESVKTTRRFTRAEVEQHNKSTNLWIIIENNVYDVTKFLQEHPGGEETLLEFAGKDGTEAFVELVGHSSEARELLESFYIGELIEAEKSYLKHPKQSCVMDRMKQFAPYFISSAFIVGAFVAYRIYRSSDN